MDYKLRKKINKEIQLTTMLNRNERNRRKQALKEVKFEWDWCATLVTWKGKLLTVITPSHSKYERAWMIRAIARTIEVVGK